MCHFRKGGIVEISLVAKSPNTKKYSFGEHSKNYEQAITSIKFFNSRDLVAGSGCSRLELLTLKTQLKWRNALNLRWTEGLLHLVF